MSTMNDRWSSRLLNLADDKDAAAFLNLMDAYAEDPAGGGQPLAPDVRARLVPEILSRSTVIAFGGFVGGTPVALANGIEGFSTFAAAPLLNIHDFIVLSSARGQGIAQRFLHDIEAFARTRGYCKLTLEVLASNHAAQRAYTKFGFAPYRLGTNFGAAEFWQKRC